MNHKNITYEFQINVPNYYHAYKIQIKYSTDPNNNHNSIIHWLERMREKNDCVKNESYKSNTLLYTQYMTYAIQ